VEYTDSWPSRRALTATGRPAVFPELQFHELPGEGEAVPVETASFTKVIQDHLDLKARNAELGASMPLDRYITEDPFENHPLFKSEEQARLEETMDGGEPAVELHSVGLPWPGEDATLENEGAALEDGLWTRSRDFDWGD
jgi:hypothetical protein